MRQRTCLQNVFIGGVAMAVTLVAGVAVAQSPPSPQNPPPPTAAQPDPKCAPVQPPIGEGRTAPKTAPHARSTEGQAPLTDKLARGDGVLCPPKGIDPEILAPTPEVGTMPVIPPPGSPGGDPTIQPK